LQLDRVKSKLEGMLKYHYLSDHPNVLRAMTGQHLGEFDELVQDVQPQYAETERVRLRRVGRKRDLSGRGIGLPCLAEISSVDGGVVAWVAHPGGGGRSVWGEAIVQRG
jgi:hypothetical protein